MNGRFPVPVGWGGASYGRNYCNMCTCEEGGVLECSTLRCLGEVGPTCRLEGAQKYGGVGRGRVLGATGATAATATRAAD